MTKRIQEPRIRALLRLLGLPVRPRSPGEPGARLARAVARHRGPLPDRLGRRIERLVELRHRAGRRDRVGGTVFVLPPWLAADWHVVGTTAGPYAPDPERCLRGRLASPSSEGRHADGSPPARWRRANRPSGAGAASSGPRRRSDEIWSGCSAPNRSARHGSRKWRIRHRLPSKPPSPSGMTWRSLNVNCALGGRIM